MGRIKICRRHLRCRRRRYAASFHEIQSVFDFLAERFVFSRLLRPIYEPKGPLVNIAKVGVTARRESAEKVHSRRRLAVSFQQTLRVRQARGWVKFHAIDIVTPIRWQFDTITDFYG